MTAGFPLVSIVTPCLNPGDRLGRCIQSLAAQTYPRIEHIVVDGGSTDGTVDILREHPTIVWISEPDRGQTDALNKGFAMAQGDFVGWLNADDVMKPDAVRRAVETFQADGAVGWVYGDIEWQEGRSRRMRAPRTVDLESFRAGCVLYQPGSLVARWALDRVGPLDESLNLAMDFDLWVRLALAGIPGRHVPEVLATFEVHPGSKTGSGDWLGFALEEARVLRRHGLTDHAEMAMARHAYLIARSEIVDNLGRHEYGRVRAIARAAIRHGRALSRRQRAFLLVSATLPRIAGRLVAAGSDAAGTRA